MKRTIPQLALLIGAVYFCCCSQLSTAAPAVYFDRDATSGFATSYPNSQAKFDEFTSSLSSFGVATIDAAVGVNPTLSFGGTGITADTQGVLAQVAPGFSIGAQALLELDAAGSGQVNTVFSFNQYITAFGLFVIQGGDGANDNLTTFRLRDTVTNLFVDVPVQIGPNWAVDNIFFLGVSDSVPFNEVTILETVDINDGMLYDNVVAGNRVPEPTTLALTAIAGACAVGRAIRRRN
jgi:hypothetical protein